MKHATIINDYRELAEVLRSAHRDKTIVCTIGSWDLLHKGHIEYLRRAREHGHVLVVGVDSDLAYRRYKKRPAMYPQGDRQEIVAAVRNVEYVTIIEDVDTDGKWQMGLVKEIKPDVFVCNEKTYPMEQQEALAEICPIKVLSFHVPASSSPSAVASAQIKDIVLSGRKLHLRMRGFAFFSIILLFIASISTSLVLVILDAVGVLDLRTDVFYVLLIKTTPELLFMTRTVVQHLFPLGTNLQADSD